MSDITLGCYIRPDDRAAVEGDTGNIDAREGTVWAFERIGPDDDGVITDLFRVVHVHHGQLRFGVLDADHVGSVTPPAPADLDSLIKLAGKHLLAKGRRSDDPYFAVVQVCRHALSLPTVLPAVPSVFGDDTPTPTRTVCGECGRPTIAGRCPVHSPPGDPLDGLLHRFEQLGRTEQNEIRRESRLAGLSYLEPGAQFVMADIAGYDALITRWERHNARHHQVAS